MCSLNGRQRHHFAAALVYPEVGAGGFSSVDGTIEFYGRVNALLSAGMIVLDFGAGRGKDVVDDKIAYRRSIRNLKGKARLVVGVDIDSAVALNPSLDCAILIQESAGVPLASESVDMILCDNTFEHITDPAAVASELNRVLKPGGWLCARTPNRFGYIALGATIVPNRFHALALRVLQPDRNPSDVFPTTYKLNSLRHISRYFSPEGYSDHSYYYDSEPAYFGTGATANRVARAVFRILPRRCFAVLMVFKRKVDTTPLNRAL